MIKISDKIRSIITPPDTPPLWKEDLEQFLQEDTELTRQSVGEAAVEAMQRLLIFLGYSTTSRGSFKVDGDFGRGTNRAVAQFQFDQNLNSQISRSTLTYDCLWQTAHKRIDLIPSAMLTLPTLQRLIQVAEKNIESNNVLCGDFDEAITQLNRLHRHQFFSCRQIIERYGDAASNAANTVAAERNKELPENSLFMHWILAIIKQETSGVVRPRFEQHLLSRLERKTPDDNLSQQRHKSMSMGLGQILGLNYKQVGAGSPKAMFTSPIPDQVLFVARFLASKLSIVSRTSTNAEDFHKIARFYNGSGYKTHHYHESLERWFREFRALL